MDIIKVEKRDENKKAKQLRRAGIVPCCVYGGDLKESVSIQITKKDAEQIFRTMQEGSKLQIELDGKTKTVQIKERTRDIFNGATEHIQFQVLRADQKVNSVAHILLKNVDMVPGVLDQLVFEVPFNSLPKDMVDTATIDLEG